MFDLKNMPYFVIFPIYLILFLGLILLGIILRYTNDLKRFSSYVISAAIGTLPGIIIGNVLFWIIFIAALMIIRYPYEKIGSVSEIIQGAAAICMALGFIVGITAANIIGFIGGFVGGIWAWSRIQKKRNKAEEHDTAR